MRKGRDLAKLVLSYAFSVKAKKQTEQWKSSRSHRMQHIAQLLSPASTRASQHQTVTTRSLHSCSHHTHAHTLPPHTSDLTELQPAPGPGVPSCPRGTTPHQIRPRCPQIQPSPRAAPQCIGTDLGRQRQDSHRLLPWAFLPSARMGGGNWAG